MSKFSLDTLAETAGTVKHNAIEVLAIRQNSLTSLDRDDRRPEVLSFLKVATLMEASRDGDAEIWMTHKKRVG